jgi:ribosomal protein S18 acetylase RimI-like enzyme
LDVPRERKDPSDMVDPTDIPFSDEDRDVPYAQHNCPVCSAQLPLTDARMTITCAEHTVEEAPLDFEVRDAEPGDRAAIEAICDQAWGETLIDAFGTTFDVLENDNVVAMADGKLAGLVSLAIHGGELAVVLLSVYPRYQGRGVGGALLRAAFHRGAERGLPFIKAATSNDDIPSLYFYSRLGFVIYDIAIGSIADHIGGVSAGFAGIPIRDEIRMRRPLAPE